MMVFSVRVVALTAVGVIAYSTESHLPAESAISFERLSEMFGTGDNLPEIDFEPTEAGVRRRLELPDMYYDKCVFWINAARSREGLPALQRWRDFEPCSDRGAKLDSRANQFHMSISNSMYCDWANYMPIAQNTCPHWFHDGDSLESCTMAMWHERDWLVYDDLTPVDNVRRRLGADEIMCKDGRPGEYCAGHYFNLRGGSKGYNAYDRVACGFFVEGNTIWINQNFGSGKNTVKESLMLPHQWNSPPGWTAEDVTPFGFACGGDESTRPVSLLTNKECFLLLDMYQYDDCRGEYRQDYRWSGCTKGSCDETWEGPCRDFTVKRDGTYALGNEEGEDICSDTNTDGHCIDPYAINFPLGSKIWHRTRDVCRKSCNMCACTTKPFDFGFRPETPEPTEAPTEEPTLAPTPAPTDPAEPEAPDTSEPETAEPVPELPATDCSPFDSRRSCSKETNCQWTLGSTCEAFDGNCSALDRKMCFRSGGCVWDGTVRPKRCVFAPEA